MVVIQPRPIVLVLLILTGTGVCASLRAQTLAEVAKKEEERRKTVTTPAKVYTNKDLTPVPAGSTPAPSAAAGAPSLADAAKAATDGDKTPKDTVKSSGPANKDQAYWSGRRKTLQDKLDRDQTFTVALQTRINSLAADVVNRDDPAQRAVLERERQKAVADLARLQQDIVTDKKALADLDEEARHAGVPPGWLR